MYLINAPNIYNIKVIELCSKSAKDLLLESIFLTMSEIRNIAKGVLTALQYIHATGIIHRDIKAANILVTKTMEVKLCDFGLAIKYDKNNLNKERAGTRLYMAPEVVDKKGWCPSSDVWAFGVTLYELKCGTPLFNGSCKREIYDKILGYNNDFK